MGGYIFFAGGFGFKGFQGYNHRGTRFLNGLRCLVLRVTKWVLILIWPRGILPEVRGV